MGLLEDLRVGYLLDYKEAQLREMKGAQERCNDMKTQDWVGPV